MSRQLFILLLLICLSFKAYGQTAAEVCDNGIDDDNDGLVDLNDDDCPCLLVEAISLIPNPSFEDLRCCPSARSQLDCAEGWMQASEATTDLINNCGWGGWDNFPPPRPFPDGDGIMGFRDGRFSSDEGYLAAWKEYAGACLLSPLLEDSTYKFQFDIGFADRLSSPPIAITIFGTTSCDNIPFGVDNIELGCPTNGPSWQLLGERTISGGEGNVWLKTNIVVTPAEDIHAIAIGPPCTQTSSGSSTYYFFDNLVLANIRQFELDITAQDHPCSDDFRLSVEETQNLKYQWYKDGVALSGETGAKITQMYGDGDYQVRVAEGGQCRISLAFEHRAPVFYSAPTVLICAEDAYPFGNRMLEEPGFYTDTFSSQYNCDSIVDLELIVLGEIADTVSAKIFTGDSHQVGNETFTEAGEYLITLQSSLDCDSLVFLRLDLFTVFSPNVFSPNADGMNDTFTILGESSLFMVTELNIFDRWGNRVFSGTEWNGSYNGDPADEGLYFFTAKLLFNNGTEELTHGSVTLLR